MEIIANAVQTVQANQNVLFTDALQQPTTPRWEWTSNIKR